MKTIEGMLSAKGLKLAIVVSRFNEFITSKLLGGAEDAIRRTGGNTDDVVLVWVPGALSGKFDAVIALGAVIRGSTPHFDYVCAEAAKGVAQASMKTGVPVAFGILTTETIQQAVERAGTKAGNKGYDAAMSAIEMANLFKKL